MVRQLQKELEESKGGVSRLVEERFEREEERRRAEARVREEGLELVDRWIRRYRGWREAAEAGTLQETVGWRRMEGVLEGLIREVEGGMTEGNLVVRLRNLKAHAATEMLRGVDRQVENDRRAREDGVDM